MDQHCGHAERIGDRTGMLASRAAETVERVMGHVMAALHRDLLDGVGHVLDGDLQEAVSGLFRRGASLVGKSGELFADDFRVEPLVLAGAEDCREIFRAQFAGHHIGVGDGERASAPIAGWTGMGAG